MVFNKRLSLIAALSLLCSSPLVAQMPVGSQSANATAPAAMQASTQGIGLNFQDASVQAIARSLAAMSGQSVVVDPRADAARITLVSDGPLTKNEARAQMHNALRLQGFAVVDAGAILKIVPEAEAKLHGPGVHTGRTPPVGAGAQVLTQVFPLHYENAANVLNAVRPLISANQTANISPGNNMLIVTDYADNLSRIAQLVAALDRPAAPSVQVLSLRHAIASEVAPLIARLVDSDTAAGRSAAPQALQSLIVPDVRANALIVRAANAARLADIQAIVAQLDVPSVQDVNSAGNLHVVHLRHADAVTIAQTLRAAMQTLQGSAAAGAAGGNLSLGAGEAAAAANTQAATAMNTGGGNASQGLNSAASIALGQALLPSTGGMVQADPATNSLLITAPAPLFRQLRAVIDRLDTRRAQVLVEGLIVEVSDNKLAEFGVQWQSAVGNSGSTMGVIGTNSSAAGANIFNLAGAIATRDPQIVASAVGSIGAGLNIGVAPRALGQYYLGALAHFLQQDGAANILSKPNLMTLDNQEARIVIGNNVPFVTGSYASTGSAATVNPFTTVERRDVGLMLRIRPTILENGTVKLVVSQEVSNIDRATLANANGPTTSKRAIESTVLVEDGSLIMLGGLLQDSFSTSQDKVPLLGDIPVLGNLFKSENRSRNKTNLMVFLRPVVLRDAASSQSLALQRYDLIRAEQAQAQPEASLIFGDMGAPQLPALTHAPAPQGNLGPNWALSSSGFGAGHGQNVPLNMPNTPNNIQTTSSAAFEAAAGSGRTAHGALNPAFDAPPRDGD